MAIPSAIEKKAQELEERAQVLRQQRFFDDALRLEGLAHEIRLAARADAEELLTLEQAVAYSRGYDAAYLRRTLTNHGTRRHPFFRKGDIPRHPVRRNAA